MLYNMCSRCRKPITYPKRHCDECVVVVELEREQNTKLSNRRYDSTRDKKYIRFYNSMDWKRLSQSYLQTLGYQCECCKGLATEVHHIKPIQTNDGWIERLDWNNLMAVCVTCHNKKHGRFVKRKSLLD